MPPEHALVADAHAVPDGQQVCPMAPHATQLPLLQVEPAAVHMFPAQQLCPMPPQATHEPFEQLRPVPGQLLPLQQG
jgi:hypothetical protein